MKVYEGAISLNLDKYKDQQEHEEEIPFVD
jgi:hypothetical protein